MGGLPPMQNTRGGCSTASVHWRCDACLKENLWCETMTKENIQTMFVSQNISPSNIYMYLITHL
jgi:hypothetical protein